MACTRGGPHAVDRLEMGSGEAWDSVAAGGVSPGDAMDLLKQRLMRDRRFRVLPEAEKRPDDGSAVRLTLSLAFEEVDEGDGMEVRLVARRRAGGEPVRLDAYSDARLPRGGEAPGRALRDTLDRSLGAVVDQTAAQLTALEASDRTLLQQLEESRVLPREAALKILTLRRNPKVVPIWIARLEGQDPFAIRQAIGALVELRDPRSVPALIDLARRKDTGFLREIIFALEAIGGAEAEGYLYTMAQGHDEPRVREAAQAAWETLEARAKERR